MTNGNGTNFILPAPVRDRTQAAKDLLAAGWSIDDVIRVLDGPTTLPYYPPVQPYPAPPFIWSSGDTWTATTDTKVTLNS